MSKDNVKNFKHISTRLKDALSEFENIKKAEKKQDQSLIDQEKAQKNLIKNIKNLIHDLS